MHVNRSTLFHRLLLLGFWKEKKKKQHNIFFRRELFKAEYVHSYERMHTQFMLLFILPRTNEFVEKKKISHRMQISSWISMPFIGSCLLI